MKSNAIIFGIFTMQTSILNNNLLAPLSIADKDVFAIYPYGSHVYGTNSENSDIDLIAVVKNDIIVPDDTIKLSNSIDITLYNESYFLNKITQHEISVLECLFLPKEKVCYAIKEYYLRFVPDLSELRSSISAKASNSFVKAKKKIAQGDFYIGRKSLWHSFRIIMFGIQIAKHNKIVDYTVANYLYNDIVNNLETDPKYYKDKYLGLHNQLMTEFRMLAPK